MAISANFTSAIAQSQYKLYHVIEIILDSGSRYYTDRATTTDPAGAYDYISKVPKVSASKLDVQKARTNYSTLSFTLIDKGAFVTSDMQTESYLNKKVNVYIMFNDGTLTFASDAVKVFSGYIDTFDSVQPEISFKARELRASSAKPIFKGFNNLNGSIDDSTTSVTVDSTASFKSSGTIRVDDEYMTYSSYAGNVFTVTRAAHESTAAAHDDDAEVIEVFTASAVNPITLALQLLLSINGDLANDATYDVLLDGAGLSTSDIDVASFTTIRDAESYGNYTFVIDEISDLMKFIEEELLLPTLTRVVTSFEGLLTLVQLDQASIGSTTTIDNDSIIGVPKMSSSVRDIVNNVTVKYNYDPSSDEFKDTYIATDANSVTLYGSPPRSFESFEFKGMTTSAQADAFSDNYLARNSTPTPIIKLKTFLKKRLITPGSDILLESKNLSNLSTGDTDFAGLVELISISQNKGVVDMNVAYTRFTNANPGFISPSRAIVSKASETVFDLDTDEGALFKVGQKVSLHDSTVSDDVSFYANYADSTTADISTGSRLALLRGDIATPAGTLVLTGSGSNSIGYYADGNCQIKNTGAIRIKVKPNYSGTPGTNQYFISIGKVGDFSNAIELYHDTAGNLRAEIVSENETQLVAITGAWSPTAGNTYELELNVSLGNGHFTQTGATMLFVDGVQHGSTDTGIVSKRDGTLRTRDFTYINLGTDISHTATSDFSIDELIIFKSVQHSSGYTPAAFVFTDVSDTQTITDITGDTITIDSAFDVTIDTSNHHLKFSDYNDVVSGQKFWAFVSLDSGKFSDGSNGYLISS